MLVGSLTICSPFELAMKEDIHLNTEQMMSLGDSDGGWLLVSEQ